MGEHDAPRIQRSIYTARRRLKEGEALTSYNQNGRDYALPDVPAFDANGLWQRRGVYFSDPALCDKQRHCRPVLSATGRQPTPPHTMVASSVPHMGTHPAQGA
jgi:hypothetical protein